MQDTSALQRQGFVDELAISRARIGELEQDAIDERGVSEQGLRVHLARYKSLVLAIAQVIWTVDGRGAMAAEQPSWAAYTGQSFEACRGGGWLAAIHPDDRAATVAVWDRAMTARVPFELEHRLLRHDGAYRTFTARAVPVFTDDGGIREWAGIHTDITERRLAEQTLRDGERQFRELADSMPQIVWAADPDGNFDYYNQRWYDFTGRPTGIRGDQSWTDVVHPEDREACLDRWRSATASGDAYEIEYRLRHRSGAYHWFLRRALAVRDHAGRITRWYGTCTNIDAVKRTEEGLRRANIEADLSNRELEAFSYSVAHDLRSPLRSIDGFSQALLEDNAEQLDAAGRDHLARVRAAAQRMGHLIDGLLSLSRTSRAELRREPVNLTRVAQAIAARLHETDPQRSVEVVVQAGLTFHGDPILLTAVMENLLGNAWKFTSRTPEAHIQVGVTSRDGRRVFFVRDDGVGFEMAYVGKLFGTFQRLHAAAEFPGTGIGLATVQRIVRRHGGEIWAEGKVAHGATFFFTLGGEGDA